MPNVEPDPVINSVKGSRELEYKLAVARDLHDQDDEFHRDGFTEYTRGQAELIIDLTPGLDQDAKEIVMRAVTWQIPLAVAVWELRAWLKEGKQE